jgi:uncharacterized protein (TIGR02996 family)
VSENVAPEILREIGDQPDDDAPRLRYADALEAAGQADRAEFIRLQCEAVRAQDPTLTRRADELHARYASDWSGFDVVHTNGHVFATWRRGFIERLEVRGKLFFDLQLRWADVLTRHSVSTLILSGETALADAAAALAVPGLTALRSLEIVAKGVEATDPLRRAWRPKLMGVPHFLDPSQLPVDSLQKLRLGGALFSLAPELAAAFAQSRRFPKLKSLTFADDCGLTSAGAATILGGPVLESVHELTCGGKAFGDEAVVALGASSAASTLRSLSISRGPLTAVSAAPLASLHGLERLSISGSDNAAFGDALAQGLAAAPIARTLQRLALYATGLTKVGVQALAAGGPWPALAALDLGFEKLGKNVVALARSERLPALKELSLRQTAVGAAVLESLATGPLTATLTRLDLRDNPKLDDASFESFLVVDRLPRLALLSVEKTGLTAEGARRLMTRFAHVVGIDPTKLERAAADRQALAEKIATRAAAPKLAPVPASEQVQFKDRNLKLIVIEALRNKNLLPSFDPREFYAVELGKKWDDNAAYTYRVDRHVLKHLLAIPITREMAQKIDKLTWDGGHAVFRDIWRHWDGEDETFHVRDLSGIEELVNLRVLVLGYGNRVKQWAPAIRLPHLEVVELWGGGMKDIGVLAGAPALKKVRFESVDGWDTPPNQRGIAALQARGVVVEWGSPGVRSKQE